MEYDIIYLVFEKRGMSSYDIFKAAFYESKEAETYRNIMLSKLEVWQKPEYDEYGLCEGVDYVIVPTKIR